MSKEFYPTIKDYKSMGLTDYQIDELIKLENEKHYFKHHFKHATHYSAPNSIFFLDIKDTLYHSSGHGGSGVLGRSGDSLQISMQDILSLGSLLKKTQGQNFTIDLYSLCEDDSTNITYDFPKNKENIQYKIDIPTMQGKDPFTWEPINQSHEGPYKIVFISTDSVETQRNIALFLLLIYKIYINGANGIYYHKDASWIDSNEVLNLEKVFEESNYDLETFIENLPPEYSELFNDHEKDKIRNIMNNITFLSTKNTTSTKAELMKSFLDRYNIENGLNYDDYNIFACGDDYSQDGPMIKLAFELGGYGCLNYCGLNYHNDSESIRKELSTNYGIETHLPLASYSFTDFYNKVTDKISLDRTWDLAETMQDVNDKEKTLILNRFHKTNHYIKIERNKKEI